MMGFALLALTAMAVVFGAMYAMAWRRGLLAAPAGLPGKRRSLMSTTSLASLGAALVLAGGGVELGRRWPGISGWGHVAILASAAVFFLAIGFIARLSADPPMARLLATAWLLSAGCAGATAAIAAHEVYRTSGAVTTLTAGVVVTTYAAGMWLLDRRELYLVVLLAGVIASVCGAIFALAISSALWLAFALSLWVLGVGWTVLGWLYPEPLGTSVLLGTAIALAAPGIAVWHQGWLYPVGIATCAAAMAASVPLRNAVLLAFGTLGLTGYVASVIARYFHFHRSLSISQALVSSGLLIIALAALTARLRQANHDRREQREAPPDRTRHRAHAAV